MNLNQLIEKVQKSTVDRSRGEVTPFDSIPNPELFIGSLKKLNGLVGNHELKDSIASQIGYLITMRQKNPKQKIMLNTVLYGPPGVGKTQIGKVMAEIWHNTGYLKKRAIEAKATRVQISTWSMEDAMGILFLVLIVWSLLGGLVIGLYEKIGALYFGVLIVLVIITGILIWYYWPSDTNNSFNAGANTPKEAQKKETSDLISVVSREDFVDRYVGWSDKKTIKLLQDNLGKVLFIDEAYTLIEGPHDQFGTEALDALNRFLTEYPEEIVVIFAGYKQRMEETIFSVQPGLERRCMWHFECKPYTPSELFKIFKIQLGHDGWSLVDEDKARAIFNENYINFTNFGGDTEKLTNFSQMAYSDDEILGIRDRSQRDRAITIDQLQRGIIKLRNNNIRKDKGDPGAQEIGEYKAIREMMRKLQGK